MAQDFAPFWPPHAAACGDGLSTVVPMPCAPAHPTEEEMALLVTELFREGTLSLDQVRSFCQMPDMSRHLGRMVSERGQAGLELAAAE